MVLLCQEDPVLVVKATLKGCPTEEGPGGSLEASPCRSWRRPSVERGFPGVSEVEGSPEKRRKLFHRRRIGNPKLLQIGLVLRRIVVVLPQLGPHLLHHLLVEPDGRFVALADERRVGCP